MTEVDRDEFTRIVNNLLNTPPKKHSDSKLGTKKKQGKIIPPKSKKEPARDQK